MKDEPLRLDVERGAKPPAVLLDVRLVVPSQLAEVERLERTLAHTADPRRERDRVLGTGVPPQQLHAALLARSSSCSLVLAVGSSTTAASSSRRTRPTSGPSRDPELDQIAAVDREITQPVRAFAFLLQQADQVRRLLVLLGRRTLGTQVDLLVQSELVRHLLPMLGEHPAREPRIELIERERVVAHDRGHTALQPYRIAQSPHDLAAQLGPELRVSAVRSRLAEIVEERREPHLERQTRVCCALNHAKEVLVE